MSRIFFCPATQAYLILKDRRKRYFTCQKVGKTICSMFVRVRHNQLAPAGPYIDRKKKT